MKVKRVKEIKGFPDLEIVYKPNLPGGEMGLCFPHIDRIEVSLKENPTQRIIDKTVKHELFHYTVYQSGWTEVLRDANVSEEGLVTMLENQFSHLITLEYEKDKENTKD